MTSWHEKGQRRLWKADGFLSLVISDGNLWKIADVPQFVDVNGFRGAHRKSVK